MDVSLGNRVKPWTKNQKHQEESKEKATMSPKIERPGIAVLLKYGISRKLYPEDI